MQIKKDEVRIAILKEAEREFYEKGFNHASIRKIVKAAGTTIGNFYNYFENKEALFEALIGDEFRSFLSFIENHEPVKDLTGLQGLEDGEKWRGVLGETVENILPLLSDRFVLLVEGSRDTNFEGIRRTVVGLMKAYFTGNLKNRTDGEVSGIIAEQLLDGFVMILKRYREEEDRKRLLTEYLLFYYTGVAGLPDGSLFPG